MSFSAARRMALRGHRHLQIRSHATSTPSRSFLPSCSTAASTTVGIGGISSPLNNSFHHNHHHHVHNYYHHQYNTMSTIAATVEDEDSPAHQDNAPKFSSIPSLHPSSLHAIEHKLKLSTMTEIQHKTFEAGSSGQDILGRARTGTGKTLAFLLPAVENALRVGRVPGPYGYNMNPGENGGIAILILSPTRELAMQIHNQAQILTASHANGLNTNANGESSRHRYRMSSQVMYGGSPKHVDVQKLEDTNPYVLVATPGRLIDHMENSTVRGVPFSEIIGNVSVWVLDEADRCLDMGFQKDMNFILGVRQRYQKLARQEGNIEFQDKQTLLFSATLPKDLRSIMASHMRSNYLTVDCVHDIDPASHTNEKVDQSFVTLPESKQNRWIAGLVDMLEDVIHVQNPSDYKIVVFFPTTGMCQLFSELFNKVFKIPVLEIHSKKNQSNRTKTSDMFRKWKKGILFTTDVSARGVDYPNVTHVIQYGSAENRETYIHRLGRTGRAGKKGRGIIVCGGKSEQQAFISRELKGLDVKHDLRYQNLLNGKVVAGLGDGGGGLNGANKRKEINQERLDKVFKSIGMGRDGSLKKTAERAYRSLLGYNLTKMQNLGMTRKVDVVDYINSLATQMGFTRDKVPTLDPRVVSNLGLKGIRGINVGSDRRRGENDGSRGGGGRPGGRGGGRHGDPNPWKGGGAGRKQHSATRQRRQSDGFQQRWDS